MTSETRYMRNNLTENKQYATSYSLTKGSLNSGDLTKLQASDNDYMIFDSETVGADEQVIVEFEGTHSGHMPFLQERIELKASVSLLCRIQVYDYDAGAYPAAGSQQVSFTLSTSEVNKYLYALTDMLNSRGAGGAWKIKITATDTGAAGTPFTLSLDYLYYRTVAYELGTSRTATCLGMSQNVRNATVGIRAWIIKSDDTEQEVDPDGTHAQVTGPSSTSTLSNTWACPETADMVACLVRVYYGASILITGTLESGGLPAVFITEDLNDTLSGATWTVYYSFVYYGFPIFATYYQFGKSTCDSRVENFSYGVVVKHPIGDGFTFAV